MVAFADEDHVISGTTVGRVRSWQLQRAPLQGTVEDIRLWAEVKTGLRLDDQGQIQPLDTETWRGMRAELRKRDGRR